MSHEAPQHDRELEPSDDTIATLQHAVAAARERLYRGGRLDTFRPADARRQVFSCLGAGLAFGSGYVYRPTATEWLEVARLAVQAYEYERAREQGL